MGYYKVNLPDKVLVAEAQSLAQIIYFMAEENMIDQADNGNPYFSVEPLDQELKVKGVPHEIALFNLKIDMIKDGYDGEPDEWCLILEADEVK